MATVLTARPWEETFVSFARETGAVRVVARAYEPEEVTRRGPSVIVAGSETSWVSPAMVKAWRRRGIRVVGVYPAGDEPGRHLFDVARADASFSDDVSSLQLLRAVRALSLTAPTGSDDGTLIAVTGPRGAPGRTEVAIAIAWSAAAKGRTLLVDLDPPTLGLRFGLPPLSDLGEALDFVRSTGSPPIDHIRTVGPISVLTGVGEGPLTADLRAELVRSALGTFDVVVADLGPWPHGESTVRLAATAVMVCDASPAGLVRAAQMVRGWSGPTPLVVVNRVDDPQDALLGARRALGLDPAVLIPTLAEVRTSAVLSRDPTDTMVMLGGQMCERGLQLDTAK